RRQAPDVIAEAVAELVDRDAGCHLPHLVQQAMSVSLAWADEEEHRRGLRQLEADLTSDSYLHRLRLPLRSLSLRRRGRGAGCSGASAGGKKGGRDAGRSTGR